MPCGRQLARNLGSLHVLAGSLHDVAAFLQHVRVSKLKTDCPPVMPEDVSSALYHEAFSIKHSRRINTTGTVQERGCSLWHVGQSQFDLMAVWSPATALLPVPELPSGPRYDKLKPIWARSTQRLLLTYRFELRNFPPEHELARYASPGVASRLEPCHSMLCSTWALRLFVTLCGSL